MRLADEMAWDITVERCGKAAVVLIVNLRKGEASVELMRQVFKTEEKAWVKLIRKANDQLLRLGEINAAEEGSA